MSQASRLRRSSRRAGLRTLLAVLLVGAGVTMSRGSDVLAAAGRLRPSAEATAKMTGDPPTRIAAPSGPGRATLAQIVVGVKARSGPGEGRRVWWAGTATSWSAEPQVLLVLRSAVHHGRLWLCVLLPIRPDGATGWIPRDNVTLLSTRYWITVNKRTRTVTIYRDGRRVHRYEAVIGKPATPTPDGLAAIFGKRRTTGMKEGNERVLRRRSSSPRRPRPCVGDPRGRSEALDRGARRPAIEPRNAFDRGADAIVDDGRQHRWRRFREPSVDPAGSENPLHACDLFMLRTGRSDGHPCSLMMPRPLWIAGWHVGGWWVVRGRSRP